MRVTVQSLGSIHNLVARAGSRLQRVTVQSLGSIHNGDLRDKAIVKERVTVQSLGSIHNHLLALDGCR